LIRLLIYATESHRILNGDTTLLHLLYNVNMYFSLDWPKIINKNIRASARKNTGGAKDQ